jgi:hypothetical protein
MEWLLTRTTPTRTPCACSTVVVQSFFVAKVNRLRSLLPYWSFLPSVEEPQPDLFLKSGALSGTKLAPISKIRSQKTWSFFVHLQPFHVLPRWCLTAWGKYYSVLTGVILVLLGNCLSHAEEIKQLAEEVQNPVSDLVRVDFTNGTFFGAGLNNNLFNNFAIETSTTRRFGDWALLNRVSVPIVYLPANAIEDKSGSMTGLGDIQYTGFLVRDESKRLFKLFGGIGPSFIFNSATDNRLGLGKWSVGPTLALVSIPDPWVVGAIARNIWSFAGDDQRPNINVFSVQPFVNYNFPNGWYLTSTPAIIANWKAEDSRNRWTVPIGGGIGKVMFRGEKRPINIRLQGFYYLEKPDFAPDWSLQLQFQILFPDKGEKKAPA